MQEASKNMPSAQRTAGTSPAGDARKGGIAQAPVVAPAVPATPTGGKKVPGQKETDGHVAAGTKPQAAAPVVPAKGATTGAGAEKKPATPPSRPAGTPAKQVPAGSEGQGGNGVEKKPGEPANAAARPIPASPAEPVTPADGKKAPGQKETDGHAAAGTKPQAGAPAVPAKGATSGAGAEKKPATPPSRPAVTPTKQVAPDREVQGGSGVKKPSDPSNAAVRPTSPAPSKVGLSPARSGGTEDGKAVPPTAKTAKTAPKKNAPVAQPAGAAPIGVSVSDKDCVLPAAGKGTSGAGPLGVVRAASEGTGMGNGPLSLSPTGDPLDSGRQGGPGQARTRFATLIRGWFTSLPLVGKAFLLLVILPTLLALFYFGIWASPMYVAEAMFAVRGSEGNVTPTNIAAMVLPDLSSVGTDVNIVAEYIESPDIMEKIDAEIGIFAHFSSHDHDLVSRLASDATRYERLLYWQWVVDTSLDPETGIIALSVKAYDPATAKRLAEAVLSKSEALVNAMSRRAQEDAIALAREEVKTAEKRVSRAQAAMRAFRDRSGMLDPASTAGGLQGIVSELESEIVKVRAEIATSATFMSKDAPTLVGLRARLEALQAQLASEKQRLAGDKAMPDSLTAYAGEYEDLKTESEFARQQLVSAMSSLEVARVKAESQSRYVVAFQIPSLPDESLYPRPFLFSLYVLIGTIVFFGLLLLVLAAIREHTGF